MFTKAVANYCQTLQLVYPLWPSTIIGFKILGFKSLIGNGNKKVWPVLGCTGNLLDFGYWLKFWLSIHEHVTSFLFTALKKQVVFSIQKNVSLKKKIPTLLCYILELGMLLVTVFFRCRSFVTIYDNVF